MSFVPRKKNNSVRSYYKSLVKNLVRTDGPISRIALNKLTAVSYTHLDVYKRQGEEWIPDPDSYRRIEDGFGGVNSVLVVNLSLIHIWSTHC